MEEGPRRKEDVTVRLLATVRQAAEKRTERGGAMTKKPRDLEPLVLDRPAEDKKWILEIRDDSKTIVDWSMAMPN